MFSLHELTGTTLLRWDLKSHECKWNDNISFPNEFSSSSTNRHWATPSQHLIKLGLFGLPALWESLVQPTRHSTFLQMVHENRDPHRENVVNILAISHPIVTMQHLREPPSAMLWGKVHGMHEIKEGCKIDSPSCHLGYKIVTQILWYVIARTCHSKTVETALTIKSDYISAAHQEFSMP